jgi:SanA protein
MLSLLSLLVVAALLVWWANTRTDSFAQPYMYDTVDRVPYTRVAIVPGTAAYRPEGGRNPYFTARIEAAVALYKARRISVIIVSGDNSTEQYNEPRAMRKALIAMGIPKERIVLDFAGFRTLDTVIRCREVFGESRVIFVSQAFHNARAIYIGRQNQMDIIGYNAHDPGGDGITLMRMREWLARTRMMLDIHILNTRPRFLGEPVKLPK